MHRFFAVACLAIMPAATASAARLEFNLHGLKRSVDINLDRGALGLGGRLFGGHGLGLGLGGGLTGTPVADFVQTRFEDRFEDLMTEYDEGLAEIEDYYESDDYDEVVSDVDRLADRYDWFVSGVERSVDRIGDVITRANERLTFLQELLEDFQDRDGLAGRLERIEDLITGLQNGVERGIDLLTERQTNLSENLVGYRDFQGEIMDFYDTIVAAGGGTSTGDASSAAALSAFILPTAGSSSSSAPASVGDAPAVVAAAVPEPSSLALAALGALGALWGRARRATR